MGDEIVTAEPSGEVLSPRKRQRMLEIADESVNPRQSADVSEPIGLHIPRMLSLAMTRASTPQGPYSTSSALSNEAQISHLKTLCVRNLPQWATADEIRSMFMHFSAAGLETMFSVGHKGQEIITNIQVARDPDSQQCIGYAFVEFIEHAVAAEVLATMAGPNLKLPGSNKPLSLNWADGPISPSSVLENYHLYIGNLRPGLSEKALLRILKGFDNNVASVRLIPQEVLGLAPDFPLDLTLPEEEEEDPDNKATPISIAIAFYCGSNDRKVESEAKAKQKPKSRTGERAWGCGFLRLADEAVPNWKAIMRHLRSCVNSEAGEILRREPFLKAAAEAPASAPHCTTAIVLRPVLGKFDSSAPMGFRYTMSEFPGTRPKKPAGPTGGSFPQPQEMAGPVPAAAPIPDEESRYGPQNKTSLFVANLSDDTTDQDMIAMLQPFGIVLTARVAFLKHVAFVDMGDYRSVLAALSHLKGSSFKRNKLQLDWGRSRPMPAPAIRHTEQDDPTQHRALMQEKNYAFKWIQSMMPQVKNQSAIEETKTEVSKDEKAFWLASLCASIPTPPED